MLRKQFQTVTPDVVERLTAILDQDRISVLGADRAQYARDMSGHTARWADAVVWPQTAQEVSAILAVANDQRVPVTAWGAGTSLEGNPIPLHGGIVLSTERMQGIVAVHDADFQVTLQPGIGYKDLNKRLSRYGLFFAPDPGANATIGGMLANNAAGIRTVKYGACKDNVLRLQVALADGRLIRCGSRSIKQASGYDLLHMFVGSEGTLGVITEATLRLAPIPQHASAVVATFATVESAVEAVVAVRGSGLEPAALEFIDAHHMGMLLEEGNLDLTPEPTLFMEFHAAEHDVLDITLGLVQEICFSCQAKEVRATASPAERRRLWHARHHAYETALRRHPGKSFVIVDVAVPISHYSALVTHVQDTLRDENQVGYMLGHAGDGNLHVLLPFHDPQTYEEAQNVNEKIVLQAIALEGTATAEHGVGIGKARYMAREHGAALEVMRTLKESLDPHGILNPGKIFPQDGGKWAETEQV